MQLIEEASSFSSAVITHDQQGGLMLFADLRISSWSAMISSSLYI
ncbi:MAG: hypothetical protein ACM3Y8_14025 [Byssovorax cruenta]